MGPCELRLVSGAFCVLFAPELEALRYVIHILRTCFLMVSCLTNPLPRFPHESLLGWW
jgi:hypothetical protein